MLDLLGTPSLRVGVVPGVAPARTARAISAGLVGGGSESGATSPAWVVTQTTQPAAAAGRRDDAFQRTAWDWAVGSYVDELSDPARSSVVQ